MTNLPFPFPVSGKLLRHPAYEGGFVFVEENLAVGSFGGFLLRAPQIRPRRTRRSGFLFGVGVTRPMQL